VSGPPVKIRAAEAGDWDFMRKAWRATFLIGGPAVQGADKQLYFDEMTKVFAAILPTAQATIACDPEDDANQLGFACYTSTTLHFVYVLQDFRRNGIVPMLLGGLSLRHYSFKTSQGVRRMKPRDHGLVFKPCFTFGG
jgi:hypothetical protein